MKAEILNPFIVATIDVFHTMVGIDPKSEAEVSFIGSAVSQGRYLKPDDDNAILVGAAFLEKFDTRLGRKLVLMSQDDQKNIASRGLSIR